MKTFTLAQALAVGMAVLGGAAATARPDAAPGLQPTATPTLHPAPFFDAHVELANLSPEVSVSLKNDVSPHTMAELDASGLYAPSSPSAPDARDAVDRVLARPNYSPQQLEELKSKAPATYESLFEDGALQSVASPLVMASPSITFYGSSSDDQVTVGEPRYTPPDTNGDVGPAHYVHTVNTTWSVYNKLTGARILGPQKMNSFFAGFGGPCETRNDGDPIVLYDQLADRWMISQFALPNINSNAGPFYQCIAVSTTGDPTGGYYRYQFLFDNTLLNDYPHFGLWPDGYYATVNMFAAPSFAFAGMGAIAYERDKMLLGLPAQQIVFKLNGQPSPIDKIGGGLPADLDGRTLPPPGAPNIIAAPEAAEWTNFPTDRIHFFKFHVDWAVPGNSTFIGPVEVDTAAWNSLCDATRACVPQLGSATNLDAIADRFMWRLAYRNFGDYQSLVTNQTVNDGSGRAAVRWYEIRDPHAITPTIHQQSTFAPADGVWRWMGSAAQDSLGNLAVGYSGSSASVYPDIRYAGRLQGDPINTLAQGEVIMMAGGGAQTSSANRWGDYSSMSVDPVDDCTFWYSNELYRTTSTNAWSTGIGAFKFPACGASLNSRIRGTVVALGTGLPITNATVSASNGVTFALGTQTSAAGAFTLTVPAGMFTLTASAYGFLPLALPGISVADGVTVTVPITLSTAPRYVVSGFVTEQGSGNPLAATVTAVGAPYPAIVVAAANPGTGYYSMTVLGGGQAWLLSAAAAGHGGASLDLGPISADQTANFSLPVYSQFVCGGAFAAGDPTYNRTLTGNPPASLSGSATAVFYRPTAFTVSSSGTYSIVMSSGFDGFYTLYQTSFNPASPLVNALQAVDDVIGLNPAIYRSLSAGTQYVLVATTFSNGTTGAFTDTISGFGAINATCGGGPTPTPTPTPTATPTPTGTPPTPTPTPTATATPMPGVCAPTTVISHTRIPDNAPASGACISIPYLGTSAITTMTVRVAMTHTWIGDLSLWLVNPMSQSLVLMHRPGAPAASLGRNPNLTSTFPITFADGGQASAEAMGTGLTTSQFVCQQDGVCAFSPDPDGQVSTFGTLAGFVGQNPYGAWQFCAADWAASDFGAVESVTLDIACDSPPPVQRRAFLPNTFREGGAAW